MRLVLTCPLDHGPSCVFCFLLPWSLVLFSCLIILHMFLCFSFFFLFPFAQMSQQQSSSRVKVLAKRMYWSSESNEQVSATLSDRFYKWHLCHCWDFCALFWANELRSGRYQFTDTTVPYAVKICLSWLIMSDVTLKSHQHVRTLLGHYFGIFPRTMSAQLMLNQMSTRRLPEIVRAAVP